MIFYLESKITGRIPIECPNKVNAKLYELTDITINVKNSFP